MRQLHIRCGKHLPIPDVGGVRYRTLDVFFRINPGVCAVTALLFLDRGSRPRGRAAPFKARQGPRLQKYPKIDISEGTKQVQNGPKLVQRGQKTAQNAA